MKLALVPAFLFAAAACLAPGPGPSPSAQDAPAVKASSEFGDHVVAIDRAMGGNFFGTILGYDALRAYRPFNELALHARDNIAGFDEFVSNAHPTHQQITIAILSMHTLGLHDYLTFIGSAANLFDKKLLTDQEFSLAIFPREDWSDVLIKNYRDRDARRLLESITDRTDVSAELKSAIREVLSGRAWSDLETFRENCCTNSSSKSTK